MKPGVPIGSALPPRRDSLVEAASSPAPRSFDPIVAPKARDRLFELIEREQLPGDVRDTLAGALSGDIRRQQLLFQAMIDTWPGLQKNLNEVLREVKKAPWEFTPFSLRGKEPDTPSLERAELAEDTFWSMDPRIAYGEKGGPGLLESLAYGYFAGHQVLELRWTRDEAGTRPRACKVIPPRYYGYPFEDQGEDRLMFNPEGGLAGYQYQDFPPHHFLLAINGGHPGHATVAAPLRALTGYWLAATFGLKWLLNFAQLYGIPFRWATYADDSSKGKVCQMLADIGSAGWGAFPSGTKLEFVDASKSASALPQKDLITPFHPLCSGPEAASMPSRQKQIPSSQPGGLSNGGESVTLSYGDEMTLRELNYDDSFPWSVQADGAGRSLALIDPSGVPDHADPRSWRSSVADGGNPGESDVVPYEGGGLLTYALTGDPAFDLEQLTMTIPLAPGADEVMVVPEWSADLKTWSSEGFILSGREPEVWTATVLPGDRFFVRVRAISR